MVLWLSRLERFVHIEEVIGSNPIKTTKKVWQSCALSVFFIFLCKA